MTYESIPRGRHERRSLRAVVAVAVVLGSVLGAAGCGDDDDDVDVQLPNPASVYCEEQRGTVDLVEEDGGVVGYCELPDGTRIEEWELYRSATSVPGTVAADE